MDSSIAIPDAATTAEVRDGGPAKRTVEEVPPSTPGGIFILGSPSADMKMPPPVFEWTDLNPPELAFAISKTAFAGVAPDLRMPDAKDVSVRVLRFKPPPAGLDLQARPVLWSPNAMGPYLITSARTDSVSYIWIFSRGGKLAATMEFKNESHPVIFYRDPENPAAVVWTTCLGCRGEEGRIILDANQQPIIKQK